MRMTKSFLLGGVTLLAVPALAFAAPKPSTNAAATPTTSSAPATTTSPSGDAAPSNDTTAPSTTAAAPSTGSTASATSAAGSVTVGATVRDTNGGTVGKIESVDGQYAVLATTKSKVRLPLSSFGKGADGPVLAMTQAQVDAAAAAAAKTGTP